MAISFEISEARSTDAEAIASLFALSWVSPFTRLQFGSIDPGQLALTMVPRIAAQMEVVGSKFVVARNQETDDVIAVAQWTLPVDAKANSSHGEPEEDRRERQEFEDEAYMQNLPERSNKNLIMAFTRGLRQLREETLQARRHFLLENLATHPDHRGRGLASLLVEWIFVLSDQQQVLVYLDTASDNPAARLYRKLGFEEQGRNTIEDLARFSTLETLQELGCDIKHTHVAFLRFPMAPEQAKV